MERLLQIKCGSLNIARYIISFVRWMDLEKRVSQHPLELDCIYHRDLHNFNMGIQSLAAGYIPMFVVGSPWPKARAIVYEYCEKMGLKYNKLRLWGTAAMCEWHKILAVRYDSWGSRFDWFYESPQETSDFYRCPRDESIYDDWCYIERHRSRIGCIAIYIDPKYENYGNPEIKKLVGSNYTEINLC